MKIPKATWYAVKTAGKFRQGRYYRTEELGVLGRMARKAGFLVLADPPTARLAAKPAKKAVRPRKRAVPTPAEVRDGEAPV